MGAVYKDKHASYIKLMERAKLSTLANRRLQDIRILMYKVKHRLNMHVQIVYATFLAIKLPHTT